MIYSPLTVGSYVGPYRRTIRNVEIIESAQTISHVKDLYDMDPH